MTRIRKLVTTRNRIRTVLALAAVTMVLLVHPAADPADNRDDGMIFQPGAEFFFHPGKWSPDLDIDNAALALDNDRL